jgi:hypothetical protein
MPQLHKLIPRTNRTNKVRAGSIPTSTSSIWVRTSKPGIRWSCRRWSRAGVHRERHCDSTSSGRALDTDVRQSAPPMYEQWHNLYCNTRKGPLTGRYRHIGLRSRQDIRPLHISIVASRPGPRRPLKRERTSVISIMTQNTLKDHEYRKVCGDDTLM